ncbi:MAG: hypothetical protein R6V86_00195 [Spirochaetia bacterium]
MRHPTVYGRPGVRSGKAKVLLIITGPVCSTVALTMASLALQELGMGVIPFRQPE